MLESYIFRQTSAKFLPKTNSSTVVKGGGQGLELYGVWSQIGDWVDGGFPNLPSPTYIFNIFCVFDIFHIFALW